MLKAGRLACWLVFPLLCCSFRCSLPWDVKTDSNLVTVVSYNAQNLCDAVDSGVEYPEFTVSSGAWSESKYRKRLENTGRAVLSLLGDGSTGPDILCLVEVENATVLEDLRKGPFSRAGYSAAILSPADGSPINNGILSRFPVSGVKAHNLDCADAGGRYMLEATFATNKDTNLTIFLCHWKSRKGGAAQTEEARIQAAALLRSRIASIFKVNPSAEILVSGDFNESPDEFEREGKSHETAFMPEHETGIMPGESLCRGITVTTSPAGATCQSGVPILFSPWEDSGGYSYNYSGSKERLDGFLLSPGLCDSSGLAFNSFQVSGAGFLVTTEGIPLAWKANAGYSDHLPILLTLAHQK